MLPGSSVVERVAVKGMNSSVQIAIEKFIQNCSFLEKSGLKNRVNSGKPKWWEYKPYGNPERSPLKGKD